MDQDFSLYSLEELALLLDKVMHAIIIKRATMLIVEERAKARHPSRIEPLHLVRDSEDQAG